MKMEQLKENKNPVIYVLVGLPGSGKSTWIRNNASLGDAVIVSSDDIIEELSRKEGLNYSQGFDKFIGRATMQMKQNFKAAVASGSDIVWDQTNMTAKKRRGILQQIPAGYRKVAVVFDTDDREIERRLKTRAEETGKFIPPHIMKSMSQSYQAPSRDEGFDEIIKVK